MSLDRVLLHSAVFIYAVCVAHPYAATALNRSIPAIVSPDPAFDDVPQLERLDPVQAAARL
ncbi:MAG: hypothetical protein ACRDTT_06450 [Pseudonocardiaceae bacterium]